MQIGSAMPYAAAPGSTSPDKPAGVRREYDAQAAQDGFQQRQSELEIVELASRDREVRAHEQAHSAVGGIYAGAPTYSFARGPDGKRYAVAGEVSIDISPIPNDPEATLRKMELVQRAALAPAEPSAQDLRVAAQAAGQVAQARVELAQQRRAELAGEDGKRSVPPSGPLAEEEQETRTAEQEKSQQAMVSASGLDLYLRLSRQFSPPALDLRA